MTKKTTKKKVIKAETAKEVEKRINDAQYETKINDKAGDVVKKQYSFPTKALCPRCKTADNYAADTARGRQYRTCRRGICRHKWVVHGTELQIK